MSGVDVLAVMDRFANTILPGKLWDGTNPYCNQPGREGSDYANDLRALCEARAAVAELAKCCDVTVKAFEALGRTDGVVAQIEAHRECERALIEQKRALANVQGGQS